MGYGLWALMHARNMQYICSVPRLLHMTESELSGTGLGFYSMVYTDRE